MDQQTLTISRDLYSRLETEAQFQKMSIEQLIEEWERQLSEIRHRQEGGQRVKEIFEKMKAKYGLMPDSTELIREDRDSR
jgi:hypothetical protein